MILFTPLSVLFMPHTMSILQNLILTDYKTLMTHVDNLDNLFKSLAGRSQTVQTGLSKEPEG